MKELLAALHSGAIELVDLTQPLSERTPVIKLPEPFTNTPGFSLEELSRYDDDRGEWYWNTIHTGEHVGTHVDAPNHWITGRGGLDVAQIPLRRLVGAAVVIDKSQECARDPDFLLERDHLNAWEVDHGAFPDDCWLLLRTGWDARVGDPVAYRNADEVGPHTPGISTECAAYIAEHPSIVGLGVETVGTDAGLAAGFASPSPCHAMLAAAGKAGLTQLANLACLPARGAMIVVAPLPIVGGSGSPARVIAFVPVRA